MPLIIGVDENTMLIEIASAAKYTTRRQGCYILAVNLSEIVDTLGNQDLHAMECSRK